MPAPKDVLAELADILAAVQGCEPEAVQLDAKLKDLGVDSITMIEIGEELGRRFNVYLSDEAIDGFTTVKSAVNAVVHHDGAPQGSRPPAVPAKLAPPVPRVSTPEPAPVRSYDAAPAREHLDSEKVRVAGRFATWMAIIGAGLGVFIGLGSAAVIGATGLGAANLPPLSVTTPDAPTTTATTTPAPVETDGEPTEDPTLVVSSTRVSPGERFRLEGAFPELGAGATLQVQVKDPGSDWDDFPVDTQTKAGGRYATEIYTSRTGRREFRLFHEESGKSSPSVAVEIG
ncbi:acyl carrier protein [Aeromicrobium panaciterrae]|uniref:Acyl carrier protein n=1 Tax=Aeromicrobium panaciterrae TaxID=363861 RepID=A0ABU1UQ19_9ACTN|nr:acyl carrier protein [Aeromicrobium panaciterrae]MDR7087278.1 acyl carrier protein [Aeromicrobium panaciterrae]